MSGNPYEAPVIPSEEPAPRCQPQIAKALRLVRLPAVAFAFLAGMVAATSVIQLLKVDPRGLLEAAILLGSGTAGTITTSRGIGAVIQRLEAQ